MLGQREIHINAAAGRPSVDRYESIMMRTRHLYLRRAPRNPSSFLTTSVVDMVTCSARAYLCDVACVGHSRKGCGPAAW